LYNINDIDSLKKAFVSTWVLLFYLIGPFSADKILKFLKKLNSKEKPINSLIFLDVANLHIILYTETSPPAFLKHYLELELDEKVVLKHFNVCIFILFSFS